jgi:DNA modification methylase
MNNNIINIMEDLNKLTKIELLVKCEELSILKCKSKNKSELIKLIKNKIERISLDESKTEDLNVGLICNNYYVDDNIKLLKLIDSESINLIYFDPPYNTGRNFYDFNDKFTSKNDYIEFIKIRIIECHRVLKKSGSIVIHIEPKISHYFRIICDDVFGDNNFKNEIIWQTGGNSKNKYKLNRFHDTIIVYSKSNSNQTFNPIYFKYDEEYKRKSNVKYCEIYKKEYVTTAIYNAQPDVNPRLNLRYLWNGHDKQWYVNKNKMESLHNENRLEYNKSGLPRIKRFLDEMEGVPLRDIWCDINNVQSGEKLDYATQKPIKLIERIIKLYSNENDICLDIFAGSGTLGRACINENRNYLLFDINEKGKNIFIDSM